MSLSHCNCGVNTKSLSNEIQATAEITSEEQRSMSAVGLSYFSESLVLTGPLFHSTHDAEDEDMFQTALQSTEPPSQEDNFRSEDAHEFFPSPLSENAQGNEAGNVETSSQETRKRPARSLFN